MNRTAIADQVEALGVQVNNLRNTLKNENGAVFLAGLVRAAEEALLIVMNTLRDTGVPDKEL